MVYYRTISTHSLPIHTTKGSSHPKSLDIAMNMLQSFVGDGGGMAQLQTHLVSLTIQLAELMNGKEKHEQVLYVNCRSEGHHKVEFPTFE
jgi:hypothetical protein